MTTAATSLLGLALPVTGELQGTWGDTVNNSITSLLDNAVAGTTTLSTDADVTLTTTTLAANQARQAILLWTANGTTTRNITAPAQSKIYTVINKSAGTQSIVLRGAGPTTGVTIIKGESAVCAWNGSDFVKISNTAGTGSFTDLTVSGSLTLSGGTANGVAYLNGSKALTTGSALQFDGSNLGLGVTPSAWDSPYKALQISSQTSLASYPGNYTWLNTNVVVSSGANRYIANGYATQYEQAGGAHAWKTAPSGTAGNAISFTQAMTLDVNGNLMVGTTTALGKATFYGSDSAAIKTDTKNAQSGSLVEVIAAGSTAYGIGGWDYSGVIEATGGGTGTSGFVLSAYNGPMIFQTNSRQERARIDSSGNFGVGTSAPSSFGKLVEYNYDATNATVSSTSSIALVNSQGSSGSRGSVIKFFNDANATNNYTAAIGGTLLSSNSTGATGYLSFYTKGGLTDALPSERVRIDSDGNLLVGTTSSYFGEKVAIINSSATAYNITALSSSASYTGGGIISGSSGTAASSGFKSFTGYSSSGINFQVLGNGNVVNTNNSYGAISDAKLKENIVDAAPKLSSLMQVRVVNYNLKTDSNQKHLGVIAQELEKVFPAMVEETQDVDKDGNALGTTTKSVKYSVFVPMLIKAMQEQHAMIESLKQRLAAAGIA